VQDGVVRRADRLLVHQVHAAKIGADVAASVLSNVLLWRAGPTAALAVRYALPVAGSAAVLRLADLDALARTRRGRYALTHMPPSAQVVRLAGDTVRAFGASRRSWALLVTGALAVAAGWSHGLHPAVRVNPRPTSRSARGAPAPR